MIFYKESLSRSTYQAVVPGVVGSVSSVRSYLVSYSSCVLYLKWPSLLKEYFFIVNSVGSVTLKNVNHLESKKTPVKKKNTKPTIKRSQFCMKKAIRGRLLSTRMSRALGSIFAYCSNSKAVMFHSAGMMTSFGKGFQSRFLKAYNNTSTINATKG